MTLHPVVTRVRTLAFLQYGLPPFQPDVFFVGSRSAFMCILLRTLNT